MFITFQKVLSKSLPDIKILFLRLRNLEKQIRSHKKQKAPCHKTFHIRQAPLFDKTVRKAGLVHYGAGGGTRTHTVLPPTDFESVTSTIPSHRHFSVPGGIIHDSNTIGKTSEQNKWGEHDWKNSYF